MPFLTLNGTTYSVHSDAAQQKYNEHRIDRARMFDGTMRQTRGGIFREWTLTTKLYNQTDYLALVALLTSTNIPLTASGDLMDGEDVAVIPILQSASPTQTAQGFLRPVVFTLHETGGPPPADTSAVPFFFYRRGTGFYQDDAATVPAVSGDRIAVWKDQSGFNRHAILTVGMNHVSRPSRILDGVQLGINDDSTPGYLALPDISALAEGEILISLKAANDPSDSDAHAGVWNFQNSGGPTVYPTTTGDIKSSFGANSPLTFPDPADDLTEWNVLNEGASATNGRFVRLNNGTPVTQLNAGFTFAFAAFTNGFDGYSTSALLGNPSGTRFDGQVRDVVFFSSFLTAPQRRSWYDYLSGAVDDPPLPE